MHWWFKENGNNLKHYIEFVFEFTAFFLKNFSHMLKDFLQNSPGSVEFKHYGAPCLFLHSKMFNSLLFEPASIAICFISAFFDYFELDFA